MSVVVDDYPQGVFKVMQEEIDELKAENKRLRKGYREMLDCDFDDECETKNGLAERYYFVPGSMIEQALKAGK